MNDELPTDIDVSRITGTQKWRVTWKGKDLYDMEKVGINKTKLIAVTLEELINRDGPICRRCGATTWLTVDHVIPISLLRDMGIPEVESYNDKENLEILCKRCNGFKGNRLDFSNPRTKAVLQRLLDRL